MSGEVTIEKRSDGSATIRIGEGDNAAEIVLSAGQAAQAARVLDPSHTAVTISVAQ